MLVRLAIRSLYRSLPELSPEVYKGYLLNNLGPHLWSFNTIVALNTVTKICLNMAYWIIKIPTLNTKYIFLAWWDLNPLRPIYGIWLTALLTELLPLKMPICSAQILTPKLSHSNVFPSKFTAQFLLSFNHAVVRLDRTCLVFCLA